MTDRQLGDVIAFNIELIHVHTIAESVGDTCQLVVPVNSNYCNVTWLLTTSRYAWLIQQSVIHKDYNWLNNNNKTTIYKAPWHVCKSLQGCHRTRQYRVD